MHLHTQFPGIVPQHQTRPPPRTSPPESLAALARRLTAGSRMRLEMAPTK